jgi:hypothetical protein
MKMIVLGDPINQKNKILKPHKKENQRTQNRRGRNRRGTLRKTNAAHATKRREKNNTSRIN